jgi:hypothetical protein
MKTRIVLLVIGLLLGLLGLRWFFLNYEYVDDRRFIGWSKEARRNPHLAAERLITRMGTPAEALRSLAALSELPPRGVLIIGDERDVLTPNARDRLLAWVEQGGYLITEDIRIERADPLLDILRVRREAVNEEDRGAESWPLVEIELPGAERAFKVQMHELQSIERSQSLFYGRSKNANHVLHFRHGKGYVTVLNSMWFMQNYAIGKNDHAAFLHGLVALAPERSGAAFFNQPTDLSLWAWLGEYAWAVLAAGALALALYLWRIAPRFGPIAPDPERHRRSLLEHLRACGRFEWKAKSGAQLAEAAREAAWRRVARAHPELAGLSTEETQRRLAELYVLHKEDTRRLLQAGAENQGDFIRSIQVYQRVHEQRMPQGKIISGEKA